MRTKQVLIVAALMIAAFTPLWTQPNVKTLTVDTLVYLGKDDPGQAGGALFLPDGNIIALWKSIPHVIDSKTGMIIRKLDSCATEEIGDIRLSPDGTKFVATKVGPTFVIWDVPSGKIIKEMKNVNDYRFSPDGTKLYICGGNSSGLGAVRVLDANTFEEIERFCSVSSGWKMDISFDGMMIAMASYRKPYNDDDKKTNQVILIDLKDKTKYTILETLEPQVYSMEFSPNGKQITFVYGGPNGYGYMYIYNLVTKEKKYFFESEFKNLVGNQSSFGFPVFLNENILMFGATINGEPYPVDVVVTWNVSEKSLKKAINFHSPGQDIKEGKILLCSYFGAIAILDSQTVNVKDYLVPNESFLKYFNNQLEFISDKAFIGETMIYDTNGKLVANLGTQPFIIGKNIIRVNCPLQRGVYILTIKNNISQSSYKFIVE